MEGAQTLYERMKMAASGCEHKVRLPVSGKNKREVHPLFAKINSHALHVRCNFSVQKLKLKFSSNKSMAISSTTGPIPNTRQVFTNADALFMLNNL